MMERLSFSTQHCPGPGQRPSSMIMRKTHSSRSNGCRSEHAAHVVRLSILTVFLAAYGQLPRVNCLHSLFVGNRLSVRRGVPVGSGADLGRWTMRDGSASYWFRVGDVVRVDASVFKSNVDLQVQETWEKYDVDPTCCCAEQVDCNMAVRVEFPGTVHDPLDASASFSHHFAEDELVKVAAPRAGSSPVDADSLPFDGVGCAAFKLEALQIESKTRKLASFDPTPPTSSTT